MKRFLFHVTLATAALAAGCVTRRSTFVLPPVGPAPAAAPATADHLGFLQVYAAFEVHAEFSRLDRTRRRHGDYRIEFDDGRPPMAIHNDTPSSGEGPAVYGLEPGTYRVFARANGYGLVTVPVEIEPGQVTEVHLEGGYDPRPPGTNDTASLVRLPDGTPVGWAAPRMPTGR
ncbi:MAG: carboxypeptidase regulatory-like domain-containing protein [Verrucomicrobia bacterium]|nr:MAG: carboxypeptidase regulatory-like domain-containing protein [Verrucomicrobiota bacterium]